MIVAKTKPRTFVLQNFNSHYLCLAWTFKNKHFSSKKWLSTKTCYPESVCFFCLCPPPYYTLPPLLSPVGQWESPASQDDRAFLALHNWGHLWWRHQVGGGAVNILPSSQQQSISQTFHNSASVGARIETLFSGPFITASFLHWSMKIPAI